jgi:hypothetical protein
MKLRAVVESGIEHSKSEHRLERNLLWGIGGDAMNLILAAVARNFYNLLAACGTFFCAAWPGSGNRLAFSKLRAQSKQRPYGSESRLFRID